MKNYLGLLLIGLLSMASFSKAADFTIQVSPANNSVSDAQVSSISSSKISGLGSLASKSSLVAADIPDISATYALNSNLSSYVSNVSLTSSLSQYTKSNLLGSFALKNSLLASDIPTITSTQVSGLGSLASKSTITNSEVADSALSINKIANFASAVSDQVSSSVSSLMSNYVLKTSIKTPQTTYIVTGSGTYSVPAGASYLSIRMIGGGGGGGPSASQSTPGGNGSSTTFGSLLNAGGGSGGDFNGGYCVGGTATISTPAVGFAMQGGRGGASATCPGTNSTGGFGAPSPLYGGVGSAYAGNAGGSAPANTGAGGSGGGCSQSTSGSGGCAGGWIEAKIYSPLSSYSYSIGTGGASGTGGWPGGSGGTGYIEVTAFFQ
jgi:hypothetical protein